MRWHLAGVVLLLLLDLVCGFWSPVGPPGPRLRRREWRTSKARRYKKRYTLFRLAFHPVRSMLMARRTSQTILQPSLSRENALKRSKALSRIASPRLGSGGVKSVRSKRPLQVVTDIDDTVKSSGGVKLLGVALGGIDTSYRRGQFYPGATQFALELARFGMPKGREPPRVAVLTARAREFKFALELKPTHPVCLKYSVTGVESGVEGWGVGVVLYGSVKEWICQSRKGLRKFRNFEVLKSLDPSNLSDYVFVGDTGERDQQAGESMIRKYPDRFRALFLHWVSETRPKPQSPPDRTLRGVPIVYFRTYVGAATKAVQLGLLDARGLAAVVEKAVKDLEACPSATDSQWDDLFSDIDAAFKFVQTTQGTDFLVPQNVSEFFRSVFQPPPISVPELVKVPRRQ